MILPIKFFVIEFLYDICNKGSATPQNIESWLKCEGTGEIRKSEALKLMGHDIYAIGTQVSENSGLFDWGESIFHEAR